MKAIQVRYLSPTATLGARLKAFTEAGSITEPYDYEIIRRQPAKLAKRFVARYCPLYRIAGSGTLPNGDWVFTIKMRLSK